MPAKLHELLVSGLCLDFRKNMDTFDFPRTSFFSWREDGSAGVANQAGPNQDRRLIGFPARVIRNYTNQDYFCTDLEQESWYEAEPGKPMERRICRYTNAHARRTRWDELSRIETWNYDPQDVGTVAQDVFDRAWEDACIRRGGDPREKRE